MAAQVHLKLMSSEPTADCQASWVRLQPAQAGPATKPGLQSVIKQGDLKQAGEDIGTDPLVVYIPGLDVLLSRIKLPAGRRNQLLKALPFALEDNLIDDVDTLHCALGPRLASGQHVAAVIAKSTLQQWLALLHDAGLQPQALLPDSLLLPWQPNSWSLFADDNQVRVRTGAAQGFVCHPKTLATLLPRALENSDAPDRVRLFNCDSQIQELVGQAMGDIEIQSETVTAPEINMGLLLQYGIHESSLNLLQGDYAPNSRIKQQLRPWYAAAALAGVWLLVGLVDNIVEYQSLNKQSHQLQQQMVTLLRTTFPQVKKVDRPYQRFRSELKKLKLTGDDQSFNLILSQVAPVTRQIDRVELRHLRYHQGQMELLLELPDLQSLESLKQRLGEATPWQVELKSANTRDNKVQGRIVISKSS